MLCCTRWKPPGTTSPSSLGLSPRLSRMDASTGICIRAQLHDHICVAHWVRLCARSSRSKREFAVRFHDNFIVDAMDSRGKPGGSLSLVTFGPRAHLTPQCHLGSVRFHADLACVHLGTPLECLLDQMFYLSRLRDRLDPDRILNANDAAEFAHRTFRTLALKVPRDGTLQPHFALLHEDLDGFPAHRQFQLERSQGVAGDFGVCQSLACW